VQVFIAFFLTLATGPGQIAAIFNFTFVLLGRPTKLVEQIKIL